MKLLIDFETRSRADLTKTGQHIYARHESTEVLCLGWKIIGENKSQVLTMPQIYLGEGTKDFERAVKESEYMVAHNAAFEQAIWNHCLLSTTQLGSRLPQLTPEKWICTLSFASILGLPRGLERVGEALSLKVTKDMEGRKLLLSMCKPRRPIQNIGKWIEWVETDDALKRLYEYCDRDLWTEEELYFALAKYKPFTKFERDLWVLDQKINQRGFAIDLKAVERVLGLINQEESELTKELQLKTFGWVKTPKQIKNFMAFLKDQGFEIPNLQKKTVDDTLDMVKKENLIKNQTVVEVLEIRQSLGKSSTSKYQALIDRVDLLDNRVRDNLLYHGAGPGRWSGTGFQAQNLPRGVMKVGVEDILNLSSEDLHTLRLLYKRPMDLFSSAIRSMIVAGEGREFFCGDFSSIEARVLLWVAGDKEGLKEYESGLDTYITMAATIFGKTYEAIYDVYKREGFSDDRQLGKKVILACGYQMGVKKFIQSCKDEGLEVPESLATRAHAAFKEKYPKIPQVWSNYEKAAIYAVMNPGKKITINKVTWFVDREFLFAQLPSGRKIAYFRPRIKNEETPWGDSRPKLYYYGVDPKTKQWTEETTYGGKLTENIVQGISRDCMAESMVRCESAGYRVLLTVHDEILTDRKKGEGSVDEFKKIMSTRPTWGQDIPLKVGAWCDDRYRK